jgi:hypothetical protein
MDYRYAWNKNLLPLDYKMHNSGHVLCTEQKIRTVKLKWTPGLNLHIRSTRNVLSKMWERNRCLR